VKSSQNGGFADDDTTIEIELIGPDEVQLSIDFAEWFPVEGINPWSFAWATEAIGNGDHTIRSRGLFGSEVSGSCEVVCFVNNIPDNILPEIRITAPMDGSSVSGTMPITGTASDEDGSIERVEIAINNGSWQMVPFIASWTFPWQTDDLANGIHLIRVRSYDGIDYSPETSISLTVKNDRSDGDDDSEWEIGRIKAIILLPLIIAVICLLAAGAVLRNRTREPPRTATPRRRSRSLCPICEGPAVYNREKDRWMCHECKKFIKPLSVGKVPSIRKCPVCGEDATYAEEYEDHYCWNCEEYVSDLDDGNS